MAGSPAVTAEAGLVQVAAATDDLTEVLVGTRRGGRWTRRIVRLGSGETCRQVLLVARAMGRTTIVMMSADGSGRVLAITGR